MVVIHFRECYEWWGDNPNRADEWIRGYLGSRKYQQLLDQVLNPDSMFRDLQKVEVYLKQAIQRYT